MKRKSPLEKHYPFTAKGATKPMPGSSKKSKAEIARETAKDNAHQPRGSRQSRAAKKPNPLSHLEEARQGEPLDGSEEAGNWLNASAGSVIE